MNLKDMTIQELSDLSLDLQADLYGVAGARSELKVKLACYTKRMKTIQTQFDLVNSELMARKDEIKYFEERVSNKKKPSFSPLVKKLLALSDSERQELIMELEKEI